MLKAIQLLALSQKTNATLVKHHMNQRILLISERMALESTESSAIKSICAVFENALSTYDGIPNEHILDVISVLFLKLGK